MREIKQANITPPQIIYFPPYLMNVKFNIWVGVENYRQYDKTKNASYERHIIKCRLFTFLLTFNEDIHLNPNQSFRYLLDVSKDDSVFRASSSKWFQMWRPNTRTLLSLFKMLMSTQIYITIGREKCCNL